MIALKRFFRRYAAAVVAAVLMLASFGFAQYPRVSPPEKAELASRFKFTRHPLPELAEHPPYKHVRAVHPSLARIASWISTLGAAVTFADLDGDGLSNDLCSIDARTDLVMVAPAPGTGDRYSPFALHPAPLPFSGETTAPMGTVAGDFNEDGFMDLMVYYWGRTPVLFLRRNGGQNASPAADQYAPVELTGSGERWYTCSATQADVDGDGHVDLIIGNYFKDNARILDAHAEGTEAMHAGKSKAFNGGRNRILLWKTAAGGAAPAATFAEADGVFSQEMERAWTLAVGAADLDGDLLPEIYFANDFGPDRLLHNRSRPGHPEFALLEGNREFLTPKSCVLGHDSFKGMGVDFGDINGDGAFDIYVSNIATKFGLCESHFLWLSTGPAEVMKRGLAPFAHGSEKLGTSRSGWGWESRFADFDNDAVLEMIQAVGFIKGKVNRWPELQALGTSNDQMIHNPRFWPSFKPGADLSGHDTNPFFVRAADGRYYDVADRLGLAEPAVSKGIATADVDGDGLLDFAVANQWEPSYFFHNEAPHPGAFLGLHLLLPIGESGPGGLRTEPGHSSGASGRPAVGAMVRVELAGGRRLVAQVDGGSGHSGRRSPDVHLGLGEVDAETPIQVDLNWRDGSGRPQHATVPLAPGWHTVWLAGAPLKQVANFEKAKSSEP